MLRTLLTVLALVTPAQAAESINVAWDAEPRSVDPRFAVDANSQYLEDLLHCSLVDFDKDGRPVAGLAKSWRWLSPTTMAVELKTGMKFSDGSALTSADVKATYDSLSQKDTKNPSPRKTAFNLVKSVTAKSPNEVLFELSEPDATFVVNLVVGVLPGKTASEIEMLTPDMPLVGCGPFKLKSWSSAAIELTRNESYTLGPAAKPEAVTLKIVKDEATRFAKLKAGEVDIVQNGIGRDKLVDIAKKIPALTVQRRLGLNTVYLGFNMKDPIVGKLAVRQAIAHAIDREQIVKYVLNGFATPATTLLTPSDPFLDKTLPAATLDLEQAKRLLDEAGFKDPDGDGGKPRLTLTYKTTTDLTRINVAKAIASQLKKVGIDVTVESLEWGRFKADVDAGKVQMWSLQWVGFKDPDIYRFAFASESFPPNGGNRGFYSNNELDKLLTAGRAENDPGKRGATYAKVQKIVNDEMPYVFLWHEEIFAVLSKAVEGYELFADGRYSALRQTHRK